MLCWVTNFNVLRGIVIMHATLTPDVHRLGSDARPSPPSTEPRCPCLLPRFHSCPYARTYYMNLQQVVSKAKRPRH